MEPGKTLRRGKVLGITGSPGTGKKTLAPLVAARLGLPFSSVEELAASYGLAWRDAPRGEVDTSALRKRFSKDPPAPTLIYGHLLPFVLPKSSVSRVAVLRCEPSKLKARLLARGYSFPKVKENVEAELIGLVSSDSFRAFGGLHTCEYDTTQSEPPAAARAIAEMLRGPKVAGPRIDWILDYDYASKLSLLLSAHKSESAPT